MNRNYLREDEDFAHNKGSTGRQQAKAAARQAQPRPITRLEAAHEVEVRALMRLRDLQSRTGLLADRLVGPPVNSAALKGNSPCGSEEFRPLVRQVEETSGYLHDAIDYIAEALDRLESL